MAKPIRALTAGLRFQSWIFWWHAAGLFHPDEDVARLEFEADGPRAFDDVVVHYGAESGARAHAPHAVDFISVKFHVDHREALTYTTLSTPRAISATRVSLLERLRDAQHRDGASGGRERFHLVTPWGVAWDDPLGALYDTVNEGLRLDVLREARMAHVRAAWRACLGDTATDEELYDILKPLRLRTRNPSMPAARDAARDRLRGAGFAPPPDDAMASAYEMLPFHLHADGIRSFTRQELLDIATSNGLWGASAPRTSTGVDTLPLVVPEVITTARSAPGIWLSYVARTTTLRGRDTELQQLRSFLNADGPFRWWLVTGAGGVGKSRLAAELCTGCAPGWTAGFLGGGEPYRAWSTWTPTGPTLVVIDYAGTRAQAASEIVLTLARRGPALGAPVRVLLLERDPQGSWRRTFEHAGRQSDRVVIDSHQYALPLELKGLSDEDLTAVAADVAAQLGARAEVDAADTAAWIRAVDPGGRPLFAMIAAVAVAGSGDALRTRCAALDAVLEHEVARWEAAVPAADALEQHLNLAAYSTMLGGVRLAPSLDGLSGDPRVDRVLPAPIAFDEREYCGLVGASREPDTAPGLEPDLLGEYFVLRRLAGPYRARAAAAVLVDGAWDRDPAAMAAFVRRAVVDFPDEPAARELQSPRRETPAQRAAWARLVVDLLRAQDDSGDAQSLTNLNALRDLVRDAPGELPLSGVLADAETRFGFRLIGDGRYAEADDLLTRVLGAPDAPAAARASALNNRGIARHMVNQAALAIADYTVVIEMPDAPDEARACALNNRADLFSQAGDDERAIVDRTAVIALRDTTFDRRFIARVRRARALRRLGRPNEALDDVAAILDTPDIVLEQKMAARLLRAEMYRDQGRVADALTDLECILAAPVNFDRTLASARDLRTELVAESVSGAGEPDGEAPAGC